MAVTNNSFYTTLPNTNGGVAITHDHTINVLVYASLAFVSVFC